MSKKWTIIATNALESWEPEYTVSDPVKKRNLYWEKRYKSFKTGMRIEKMKFQKPKKVNKDKKHNEEEE